MTTIVRQTVFRQWALVTAIAAALSPVHAEESVVEGSVSAGVGAVSDGSADRALFGQYNGLRPNGAYGLLDFDYYRRIDATATVTWFKGSDVLGENRELDFMWKRQGDWRFVAQYGELVRREPLTVNTGLLGAGTTTPQVVVLPGGPGTGADLELKTKRAGLGLAFSKWLAPSLQLDLSVKSENKDGARLFGRGFNCPSPVAPDCAFTAGANPGWAVLFVPEPINANHTQLEARLSYAHDKLRVSAGYYGSYFNNTHGSLSPGVPGALNNATGVPLPLSAGLRPILTQAIALAPDSDAHHLDMTGTYAFTPTTRAKFKIAHSRASQNQDFLGAGLSGAPSGVTNLGGKVDTMSALVGLTARPTPKLSLNADLRYEDRDDETPLAYYKTVGTIAYTNRNYSRTRTRGQLQANYQFSSDYRGTLAADFESIDRDGFTATSAVGGVSALRQKTDELGYRAELRRRMSDEFSGTIALSTSRRDGSYWLRPNGGQGVTAVVDPAAGFFPSAIFMPSLADRRRDKIRLLANWAPAEGVSLQFSADTGRDSYDTPTEQGLRKTRMNMFTVDFDYAPSASWSFNGYLSHGNQTLDLWRPDAYRMDYDNRSTSVGLGVTHRVSGNLQLGAALSFLRDRNTYAQSLAPTAHPSSAALLEASGGLPDIVLRRTELTLYGVYKLGENSSMRVDLIHYRASFDDWAWGFDGVPFRFSDNTTVTQLQRQDVTFVGVRYIHRWK